MVLGVAVFRWETLLSPNTKCSGDPRTKGVGRIPNVLKPYSPRLEDGLGNYETRTVKYSPDTEEVDGGVLLAIPTEPTSHFRPSPVLVK